MGVALGKSYDVPQKWKYHWDNNRNIAHEKNTGISGKTIIGTFPSNGGIIGTIIGNLLTVNAGINGKTS